MTFAETFVPEFDHEMSGTRAILESIPNHLLDWKAHSTLNSIGWVGSHIVDTLSWVEVTLKDTSFDIAPVGGPPHTTPILDSSEQIVKSFDHNLAVARPLLLAATDEELSVPWTLLQGGNEIFTMPRRALAKNFFINHLVHHRAFLVAYLRMNDIDCQPLYG